MLVPLTGLGLEQTSNAQMSDATAEVVSGTEQTSIAGDLELLPQGDSTGELSVLAHSLPLDYGVVAVIARNGTDDVLSGIELKAEARVDGQLVGVKNSFTFQPSSLAPGDFGLGYFSMDDDLDPTASITFKVVKSQVGEDERYANVSFGTVNGIGSSVVGEVVNPSSKSMESVSFLVVVLNDDGEIIDSQWDYLDETVNPSQATSFQIEFYKTDVKHFLIAGSGR